MTGKTFKSFASRRPHLVPCLAAAAMLLGAMAHWPYGYYTLLRWVTCLAGAFVAFLAFAWEKPRFAWPAVGVAILFNPLVPIHLDRETWRHIDIGTAVAFLAAAFLVTTDEETRE